MSNGKICAHIVVIIAALIFPTGCSTIPPRDFVDRSRTIAVVPVQAIPFALPHMGEEAFKAGFHVGLFAALGVGVLTALDGKSAEEKEQEARRIHDLVTGKSWSITRQIAAFSADDLNAGGKFRATVQTKEIPLNFEGKPPETYNEWFGSVLEWYQLETSPISQAEADAADADMVIESAIAQFQTTAGWLGIQMFVYTKVIDPTSGKVVGKTVNHQIEGDVDTMTMLKGDAQPFKAAAEKLARQGVAENLEKLGLITGK